MYHLATTRIMLYNEGLQVISASTHQRLKQATSCELIKIKVWLPSVRHSNLLEWKCRVGNCLGNLISNNNINNNNLR